MNSLPAFRALSRVLLLTACWFGLWSTNGARAENFQYTNFLVAPGRSDHWFTLISDSGDQWVYNYGYQVFEANTWSWATGQWVPERESATFFYSYLDWDRNWTLRDDTTGEIIELGYIGQGVIDLRWYPWANQTGAPPMQYFLLPTERQGHQFALLQPDGSVAPVSTGAVTSYGFSAWGLYQPSQSFWLVDIDTSEKSATNQTDLAISSWVPNDSPLPMRTATILVPDTDVYWSFTLNSQGSAQWLSAYPVSLDGQGFAAISGAVTIGAGFTVQRMEDYATSPVFTMSVGDQLFDLRSAFPIAPHARSMMTVNIRINANRSGHTLAIHHADGYRTEVWPWGWYDYIWSWDDYGNENSLYYFWASGNFDGNHAWTLVDESNNNEVLFSTGAYYNYLATIDVFDGWQPIHTNAPQGQVSLTIPSTRRGHQIRVKESDGSATWLVTDSGYSDYTTGFYGPWGNWITLNTFQATGRITNYWNSFTLVDETTGEEAPMWAWGSYGDFTYWLPQPSPLYLNISATRWLHNLWVRQADGSQFQVNKGSLQGVWYDDQSGNLWFTNYGFFDGASEFRPEFEWWVYDETTGEESAHQQTDLINWAALDANNDSDGDGLPDWYEAIVGSSSSSFDGNGDGIADGWDTDGDGMSDYDEMRYSRNPLAAPQTDQGGALVGLRVFTPLEAPAP